MIILTNELKVWLLSYGEIASGNLVKNSICRITSNRPLICFVLATAVVVDVITWVCYFLIVENGSSFDPCFALQEVGVNIFLFATVLLVIHTVLQRCEERAALSEPPPSIHPRRLNTSPSVQGGVCHLRRPPEKLAKCTSPA